MLPSIATAARLTHRSIPHSCHSIALSFPRNACGGLGSAAAKLGATVRGADTEHLCSVLLATAAEPARTRPIYLDESGATLAVRRSLFSCWVAY